MAATDLAALVGRNIRSARRAADLTQNELSAALGASGPMIVSTWELGKARPNDKYLVRLSEVLGHDTAWFFTDHTPREIEAAA